MTTYFRYYDARYGDTYEIYLSPTDGSFLSACRWVEAIGRDAIYYDDLSEVPPHHRNEIETLMLERQKRKDGN